MALRSKLLLIVNIFMLLLLFDMANAQAAGSFKDELILKALPDGENFVVQGVFRYLDSSGKDWDVPPGSTTDGASVPRALWSLFPPLNGKYLRAAVVHDYYCQIRARPWRDVHRVFYDAMLAAGVNKIQAKVMYSGVYTFGPRWTSAELTQAPTFSNKNITEQQQIAGTLQTWIAAKDPTLDEIEARISEMGLR